MEALNTGDTAFLLISAALVMLMTPALGLFYGGMVRQKNVLGTIMHSFFVLGLVSVIWAVVGYTLAFGPSGGSLFGGLKWVGLEGVGQAPYSPYAPSVPHLAFMVFQLMFAVITPALITGAIAERMKFGAFVTFIAMWSVLVYSPIAHWVWGLGGWIRQMGALDFAGGTVVHISSGAAALAAALAVGRRRVGHESLSPHNVPLTILGAAMLWFGWFGFNAGSALTSAGLAASAFVTTHLSAAAATLSWAVMEWRHRGRATTLGAASGCVTGLVAITPAAGFVTPGAAILIGLAAGAVCYLAVHLKRFAGYDDTLDVVGVHGAGGIVGALGTGIFAVAAVNSAGANGLLHGNPHLLLVQAIAIVSVIAYSFTASFIILKVIDWVMGLRVSEEHEEIGLDLTQHSEAGYAW
jgi:Amt family ammonium transporter